MFLPWEEKYSVGITLIDYQHKKLIKLINELHQALESGKGSDAVGDILKGLVQYTRTHFATEEKLMGDNDYPKLDQHKAFHKELVARIQEFQEMFEAGKSMLSISIMNFLKDWLKTHILEKDMDYSPFLTKRGIN